MAHGILHGVKHGIVHSTKHGVLPLGAGLPGVARDSASGIYCPASTAQWTTVMAAAGIGSGNPTSIWLCNEASGDMIDQGVGALNLTASGTGLAYTQAQGGWTRPFITTTEAGSGQFLNTASVDILTNSALLLSYVNPSSSAALRSILALGVAATRLAGERNLTTGTPKFVCGAQSASGAVDATGQVRPWIVQINRTASSDAFYNNAEVVNTAFGTTAAGASITYGRLQNNCATAAYGYGAYFIGGAAELTLAQIRTLLQTLGWPVAW